MANGYVEFNMQKVGPEIHEKLYGIAKKLGISHAYVNVDERPLGGLELEFVSDHRKTTIGVNDVEGIPTGTYLMKPTETYRVYQTKKLFF